MKGSVKFISKEKKDFFEELKHRVDNYFIQNNISKHANALMVSKSFLFLSGFIVPFIAILYYHPGMAVSLLLWTVMGWSVAGIGMSIMHDANHGSYSSNRTVNYLMGHTLNLIGGSVENWKLQHNILHHTYTNVHEMDDDIQDRLVLIFSPHSKTKGYHRFQHLYAFFLYGLLTLYWTVAKDIIQFFLFANNGVNPKSKAENRAIFIKIVAVKVVHFALIFFVPIYFLNFSFGEILAGYLMMHFWSGLILTVVFQLAHTVDGTTHPLPNEKGVIENNWAIHQMNTTMNFSRKNKWISYYVGGLNFQVEHHLFPKICHVHYPAIAEIVKATAEEYGVPYLENKTFFDALRSHIRLMYKIGHTPHQEAA